jgi:hypothetical protein
MSARDEKGLEN